MPARYEGVDNPMDVNHNPWLGADEVKPWDYDVTVMLPHLDTPEHMALLLDLYRHQEDARPYFIILDTGSTPEHFAEIEKLNGPDCEVQRIRLRGVLHPSDPVSMAMDLAQSICRTRFYFATHTDVFPRNRRLLRKYIDLGKLHKVAGYEMTERRFEGWKGMVSHTASIFDTRFCDQIGMTWSMRRTCSLEGLDLTIPDHTSWGWPDTETTMNLVFRQHDFQPFLTGKEENYIRTLDDDIDHVRSTPSAKQYNKHQGGHWDKMQDDWSLALQEATDRLKQWAEEK